MKTLNNYKKKIKWEYQNFIKNNKFNNHHLILRFINQDFSNILIEFEKKEEYLKTNIWSINNKTSLFSELKFYKDIDFFNFLKKWNIKKLKKIKKESFTFTSLSNFENKKMKLQFYLYLKNNPSFNKKERILRIVFSLYLYSWEKRIGYFNNIQVFNYILNLFFSKREIFDKHKKNIFLNGNLNRDLYRVNKREKNKNISEFSNKFKI